MVLRGVERWTDCGDLPGVGHRGRLGSGRGGPGSGERPGAVAAAGIALALAAVVLISREAGESEPRPHWLTGKVAWLTVGSGLALGLNFVCMDQTPAQSRLWPLLFARIAASILVIVLAAASRNLSAPRGRRCDWRC